MLASFIRLITQTQEMQGYTVQKLYSALKDDISQESLALAGVWVIGEYGDILVQGGNYEEEELAKEVSCQRIFLEVYFSLRTTVDLTFFLIYLLLTSGVRI